MTRYEGEEYDDAAMVAEFRREYSPLPQAPAAGGNAVTRFNQILYGYYRDHGRHDLPWRHTGDPYHIAVSEIMLQQTQVHRVVPKYIEFIGRFPTLRDLAAASGEEVLSAWQGLGYNRRALYLHRFAGQVLERYSGAIPDEPMELASLPGIGQATASSIAVFAFNRGIPFIETNIRAVFIHFFFCDRLQVRDGEILPFVEAAMDRRDPRKWFSALMDYGTMLKRLHPNPGRKSAHYRTQPKFRGSRREMRGKVIRAMLLLRRATLEELADRCGRSLDEAAAAVSGLEKEGFLRREGGFFVIP